MEKRINLPITRDMAREIKSGESVLLSGTIYTARDAAHKRFDAFLDCRLCAMRANANTAKL